MHSSSLFAGDVEELWDWNQVVYILVTHVLGAAFAPDDILKFYNTVESVHTEHINVWWRNVLPRHSRKPDLWWGIALWSKSLVLAWSFTKQCFSLVYYLKYLYSTFSHGSRWLTNSDLKNRVNPMNIPRQCQQPIPHYKPRQIKETRGGALPTSSGSPYSGSHDGKMCANAR